MTNPSDNLHSDASNGGVINQERPFVGQFLEPIVVITTNPPTESLAERKIPSATVTTPTNQKTKVLMPVALMRTSPHQGTHVGPHVEKTPKVIGPSLMQPLRGSSPHGGFQEHTHSSPTPGSRSP